MARERTRDGYGAALLLLILSVLMFAAAGHNAVGRTLLLVTQGAAVLVIFRASRLAVRTQTVAAALVAAAVVAGSSTAFAGGEDLLWASASLGALLVVAAPVAVVRRLTQHRRIEVGTVLGALCLYILAGLFFAYVYIGIGDLSGHRFFAQLGSARPVDYVYFSFVTLATLGYGDLTPASDLGRMLAVTESVLGQLYLVGAVAAIVSNLGTVREGRGSAS